jgi:D-arabinose 1-dehydrogenase-like Zn-dependent alcohol dehydrogenase
MTMIDWTLTRFCEPIIPIEAEERSPQGAEVVVEVTHCGLCHTDLHLHEGFYDLGGGAKLQLAERGLHPPMVLGHEIAGRLVARGPQAELGEDAIGQRFIVYPWIGCGDCAPCREGRDQFCVAPRFHGVFRPGGHAQRITVPHARYLIPLDGLNPTLAATYACSGITTYGALRKIPEALRGDWLLLIGMGGLGQSALSFARALGFSRIAVSDPDVRKGQLALAAGADVYVDPRAPDAAARVAALERGVASVVDLAGTGDSAAFAIAALRREGIYVVVGLIGGKLNVPLPTVVMRSLTILGAYTGSLDDLREVMAPLRPGASRPSGSRRFPWPR